MQNPLLSNNIITTIDTFTNTEIIVDIMNIGKYFKYVYMLTTQPDDIDYPLNFPSEHSSSKNIFIGSHIELNNENLINYLPNTYTLK